MNSPRSLGAALVVVLSACGGSTSGTDGGGVDGGGGGGPLVTGSLSAPTTWAATDADCDVTVKGVVEVKAALTVQPGAKVCFQAGAGLLVEATGSLTATGTADAGITFGGTSPTPGYWKGLAFLSNDVANTLSYVEVTGAGSDEAFCCGFFVGSVDAKAGLVVGDTNTAARLSLQHSTVSNSAHDGLFAFESAKLDGFAANTFTGNQGAPVALFFGQVGVLDVASHFTGNTQDFIRVRAGAKTTSPVTMRALDVPYGMSESKADQVFKVGSTLQVEAGADLRFEANCGLEVEATGTLTSTGTTTKRVTMTGRSATPGFWKGVAVVSTGNTLTNTDVRFGGGAEFCCGYFEPVSGSPSTKAALVVGDYSTSGGITLTDSTVTQSANRGLSRLKGTVTLVGTNDLLTGNAQPNLP